MKRFIEGEGREQVTLLPECLDDFVAEDNPVRIIDAFVEELDLGSMGFNGAIPSTTGHPSYHPAVLLNIYIYGYLNRVQSSRRLERECQRSVELMWLTGRLAPDFKTIADFRRDNGTGIRNVCRRFVTLCRELKLFSQALVAIVGSKFKAVNTRDRNFTGSGANGGSGWVGVVGLCVPPVQLPCCPVRVSARRVTESRPGTVRNAHARDWTGLRWPFARGV